MCVREREYARSDWSKTYAGLLHQKTYRKIKGIQTTNRKQNRLYNDFRKAQKQNNLLTQP